MRITRYIGALLITTLVLSAGIKTYAQQDPMYTQFIDNLLIVNPGFAGSSESGNLLLVSRNQWVSIDDAPVTNAFSYNTRFKKQNFGLGFSVMHDKIGPQKQTGVYFDYAYFMKVSDNFKLGLGLKGGVSFYRAALTELITIDPDPIYTQDIYKNFLPNIGVGGFLYSDKAYFGLSVPKLIENTITRENYETAYTNREELHLYIVGGYKFNLNKEIQLKTNAMFRYVKNAPISVQTTAMAGFREKFWVGGMARFGDAFGIVTQFQATPKMLIGYSYDVTTSKLNVFSNGTHEIMFSYDLDVFR